MGNLSYSAVDILFNSLSVNNVGLYFQSIDAQRQQAMLLVKDMGIIIPGAIYDMDGNIISNTSLVSYVKNCKNDGQLKIVDMLLHPSCPCSDCKYEYGITINHMHSYAGRQVQYFPDPQKYYGGMLERVECENGFITDEYVIKMEDDIIRQINADEDSYVVASRVNTGTEETFLVDEIVSALWVTNQYLELGNYAEGDIVHFAYYFDGVLMVIVNAEWVPGNTMAWFASQISQQINDLSMSISYSELTGLIGLQYLSGGNPDDKPFSVHHYPFPTETIVTPGQRYLRIQQKYPEVSFNAEYSQDMATAIIVQTNAYPSGRTVGIYKEFMNSGNHGNMKIWTGKEMPDNEISYCKYTISTRKVGTYDLVGAGHLNDYYMNYHIYVNQDHIDVPIWKAPEYNTSIVPGAPDTTFQALIDVLCGTTIVI